MTVKKDAAEFVKFGDGFADIELQGTAEISGVKVTTLRMREPTVGDQEAAEKTKGGDSAVEKMLFGNLMDCSPADISALTIRNYKRVQAAFLGFID